MELINLSRRGTLRWSSTYVSVVMTEDKLTLLGISSAFHEYAEAVFKHWLAIHTNKYVSKERTVIINRSGLSLTLLTIVEDILGQNGIKVDTTIDSLTLDYTARELLLNTLPKEDSIKVRYNKVPLYDRSEYYLEYLTYVEDIEEVVKLSKQSGDTIMGTMEEVYTSRDMWIVQPVMILRKVEDDSIVGYHAVSINNPKYPGTIKSYYINLAPEAQGKGLASRMFKVCMQYCIKSGLLTFCARTSSVGDGQTFYERMGLSKKYEGKNEYGSEDWMFECNLLSLPKFKGSLHVL